MTPKQREFLKLALTGQLYREYHGTGQAASWRIDHGGAWTRFKSTTGDSLIDRGYIEALYDEQFAGKGRGKGVKFGPYLYTFCYQLTKLGKTAVKLRK